MSLFNHKIITIMGPTATGKTALALQLAELFPIEIVSVDSALIYRDMDVGTAKPSAMELQQVLHHLINVINPDQNYSVADFLNNAQQAVRDIWQRNRLPVLVGGTMMYFHAWQHGLVDIPTIAPEVRQELLQRLKQQGLDMLYQELLRHDEALAKRLNPQDTQRITRALEVFYGTGVPLSIWQAQQNIAVLPHQNKVFKIIPEQRDALHQKIALRFEMMLEQGFLDEVKSLLEKYQLDLNTASLRCVGYRQAYQYLMGELDYQTMKERAIIATRQLAKRQLTWLKQWPEATLLNAYDETNYAIATQLIKQWIK